jgi:uncharacterized protein (TIGR01777 family)
MIGSALVEELRGAGHEVLRLVRRTPGAADERGWDPATGRLDAGALDGADGVVNLCGSPQKARRWSAATKRLMTESRVGSAAALAAAVAEHKVPALLSASGTNIYGDTGTSAVTEQSPFGGAGQFLGELARDWEAATGRAAEAGSRVVLMRTGGVLDRSGGLLQALYPLFKAGLGGRLGSGRQYMSWIALPDHVRAVRFVLENPGLSGPVNFVAPEPATNAEFTRALGAAVHRPALFTAPAFAMRLALGQTADELALVSQRVLPAALLEAGFTFSTPDIGSALQAVLAR